jgi:hypothetical protein
MLFCISYLVKYIAIWHRRMMFAERRFKYMSATSLLKTSTKPNLAECHLTLQLGHF